jgi:hypothetical protein
LTVIIQWPEIMQLRQELQKKKNMYAHVTGAEGDIWTEEG